MGRLNLKEKMGGMALLLAIGLIVQIILNYISISTLSELDELRVNSAELEAEMLMLRRHEKDFLARKDLKYTEKFAASFQQMSESIAEMGMHLNELSLDTAGTDSLRDVLLKYQDKFLELVAQQKVIGLHAKDGLYGSLRDKVHAIEEFITSYEKEHGATQYTHSLMRTMLMLRRHEKDFMLRRDLKYVDKFNKRIEMMQGKLQDSGLGNDFESQANGALKEYENDFIALVKGEERLGLNSKEGILGEMRDIIHQSESLLDELSGHMELVVEEHIQQERMTNIASGVVLALFIVVLLLVISRGITKRITSFSAVMTSARREKDLTARVEVSGGDEIASMASVYNEMMDEFDGLLGEIKTSSISLAAAAEQLKTSTTQAADGANRQLIESEQVATAMNEMSTTVSEVANNASRAAEASALADEASSRGHERVVTNRDSFTQLAANIENAGDVIERLSDESNNIGGMLNVIRGIAEQTNLLALNAAIEAARAGEQGRGFAVVADEVRTLAQRSAQSTQDIEDVVSRLQNLASDAVAAMSRGRAQAEESVENATNVEKALNEINDSIETVNSMNIQIATAAEEQSNVSEEINRSVYSITDVARETSQITQTIAAAGEQLQSLSEQLGDRVSRFRLS